LTKTAKIDFAKPHPPLLLIAGSEDHIVPSSLNYSNFKKYKNFDSITTFKEFRGRNHFVLGQSNWMEVANFTADWLEKIS
jgi:alpha-beta hydrolase superfamily lysophospholipase